jgi:dTDP-4-amino-4,6-dideoxygalactose transaminase
VLAEHRDDLLMHLLTGGVDAKVHYPVPIHLQPAAESLGHKTGSFPIAEAVARQTITLPAHDFITEQQIWRMAELTAGFYISRVHA